MFFCPKTRARLRNILSQHKSRDVWAGRAFSGLQQVPFPFLGSTCTSTLRHITTSPQQASNLIFAGARKGGIGGNAAVNRTAALGAGSLLSRSPRPLLGRIEAERFVLNSSMARGSFSGADLSVFGVAGTQEEGQRAKEELTAAGLVAPRCTPLHAALQHGSAFSAVSPRPAACSPFLRPAL